MDRLSLHSDAAKSSSLRVDNSSQNQGSQSGDTQSHLDANATTLNDTQSQSKTDNVSVGARPISPRHELFLYELETSDAGSVALVLRAIYDGGGDVERFQTALKHKIAIWDREIEKQCQHHYEGYVEAVKQLLELRQQCTELKTTVQGSDEHLQSATKPLLKRSGEILRCRKLQRNISVAIDSISLCLPILEKYAKLSEQMQQKRYYQALKTLEQLEHTYLPQIRRYRFIETLGKSVADIRQQIRDSSFAEFKDFLENVRKVQRRIGETALQHTAEIYDLDSAHSKADRHRKRRNQAYKFALSSQSPISVRDSMTDEDNVADENDENVSAQDMIDFSPVYRCAHIFTVLSERDAFSSAYRAQRMEQANLLMQAPRKMHVSPDAYLHFFHELIGFFVVEDHIMHTCEGLVTSAHREQLWLASVDHCRKSLYDHFVGFDFRVVGSYIQ